MKINFTTKALVALAVLAATACTKPEGEGGTSTITGKVYAFDYNGSGILQSEFYAPDEDVFIIYGDEDNFYDDSYKTSFDGSFRFQYLRPGTYTVFVYSDCILCESGTEAISQTVEITGNNQDIILDDLEIRK
ncbi:MAG: hypothetical protein H6602_00560 [Flavobacteriales bacterium]|nr:hypothetical protein [Flavobacteriales bacterium]MCB9190142.1 hypothetical protein [Flavobacteriales bacterium]